MRGRFVTFAEAGVVPFAQACARFGISRKTGYKWLNRFRAEGADGLMERDRSPRSHPDRTAAEVEQLVTDWAVTQPDWTLGRMRRELAQRGVNPVPAWTTLQAIQRRMGGPDRADAAAERAAPNDTWTVRAGPTTVSGGLNHRAFVIEDEATRFVLVAEVIAERGEEGIRELLWSAFERFGVPRQVCWQTAEEASDAPGFVAESARHTPLTVALMRQGVAVEWIGCDIAKVDPVAQTLDARLRRLPRSESGGALSRLLAQAHDAGPPLERVPHEALARWRGRLAAWADAVNQPTSTVADGISSPAASYRPSRRQLSSTVVDETASRADSRRISEKGVLQYRGTKWSVGRAFAGESVQLCPLAEGDLIRVDFVGQPLGLAGPALLVDGRVDTEAMPSLFPLEAKVPSRLNR
jgi:hypothetical protein